MENLFTFDHSPKKQCQKIVRCWDNGYRQCLREEGHDPTMGHNPFSNSKPVTNQIVSKRELVAV